jgi:hypothetical protein
LSSRKLLYRGRSRTAAVTHAGDAALAVTTTMKWNQINGRRTGAA